MVRTKPMKYTIASYIILVRRDSSPQGQIYTNFLESQAAKIYRYTSSSRVSWPMSYWVRVTYTVVVHKIPSDERF